MPDFAQQRRMMVDCQLRTYDVTEPTLIAALDSVPREDFVADPSIAYADRPVPMADGSSRRLMTPMVFARLAQAAAIQPGDRVLVVGAGTGYGAAVLARLAGAVVALESEPGLAAAARVRLERAGAGSVTVVNGPLRAGHPAGAPYDAILVEGAIEVAPSELLAQLAPEGRLVTVEGVGRAGRAVVYTRSGDVVGQRTITEAAAPLLAEFAAEKAFVF